MHLTDKTLQGITQWLQEHGISCNESTVQRYEAPECSSSPFYYYVDIPIGDADDEIDFLIDEGPAFSNVRIVRRLTANACPLSEFPKYPVRLMCEHSYADRTISMKAIHNGHILPTHNDIYSHGQKLIEKIRAWRSLKNIEVAATIHYGYSNKRKDFIIYVAIDPYCYQESYEKHVSDSFAFREFIRALREYEPVDE